MELRCSRDLAIWLGAVVAENVDHAKAMKRVGHLVVRDNTGLPSLPMFWPWASDMVGRLFRQRP